MKHPSFDKLSSREQELLQSYANESISTNDFEEFQDLLLANPQLRFATRRYLGMIHTLEVESGEEAHNAITSWTPSVVTEEKKDSSRHLLRYVAPVTLAAAACVLLGWAFFFNSKGTTPTNQPSFAGKEPEERQPADEPSTKGYGVIGRLENTQWASAGEQYRSKDLLNEGTIHLLSGTAELRFFSGAVVTIAGPTKLDVKSAWEAVCEEGTVRVQVPPAATGFAMHGPHTKIIDLGTEFGLDVRNGETTVEVFQGSISIQHREEPTRLVEAGKAWKLPPNGPAIASATGSNRIPPALDSSSTNNENLLANFERWKTYRDAVAADPRVIAYYTFDEVDASGLVKDLRKNSLNQDGTVILADSTDGRWNELNKAMNFRRPGSRVRVNIPGEFEAFTFMCWVRIDSLDRWYNALFMGDGFETGEPHWQIQDNGTLMISIRVDDERPNSNSPAGRGFHKNYNSPPFWDQSMSGKWVHLASSFDPATRSVRQYVNGKKIHHARISPEYHIDTLRIGNAEIGNWGDPIQTTPDFAIRNLNGHMDELAIYSEALTEKEIRILFERSSADHQ